jgi:hypothetical protein
VPQQQHYSFALQHHQKHQAQLFCECTSQLQTVRSKFLSLLVLGACKCCSCSCMLLHVLHMVSRAHER